MADAGKLIRAARRRHGIDQRTLARRAGTSQTQISRIERSAVSPSVSTLERLLAALGERLELVAVDGHLPDHAAERQREYASTTPAERVVEAIALSRAATRIAAAAEDCESVGAPRIESTSIGCGRCGTNDAV